MEITNTKGTKLILKGWDRFSVIEIDGEEFSFDCDYEDDDILYIDKLGNDYHTYTRILLPSNSKIKTKLLLLLSTLQTRDVEYMIDFFTFGVPNEF